MWLSNSIDNLLFQNTIAYNILLGIELASSNSNIIYMNNLVNNPQHTVLDSSSTCFWNNSCEGNFWDTYDSSDLDGDGIGDTPYTINGNNSDYYPLMNPYWTLGDVNHDLEVDIFDVVLACVAYSSTPIDPNWNCHCDIAEPFGAIDIFDIVMITSGYGEEYAP
jgi:parallel beta-helix repeat protein